MNSSLRVCVVVHGYEPDTWTADTSRLLSTFVAPLVRAVAIAAVPSPSFTSLTRAARRAYNGARAVYRSDETQRIERILTALASVLPHRSETLVVTCHARRLTQAITGEAERWGADVLLVGRPAPGIASWLWPGPIHERVLRQSSCAVIVTPPTAVPRPARVIAPHATTAKRRA